MTTKGEDWADWTSKASRIRTQQIYMLCLPPWIQDRGQRSARGANDMDQLKGSNDARQRLRWRRQGQRKRLRPIFDLDMTASQMNLEILCGGVKKAKPGCVASEIVNLVGYEHFIMIDMVRPQAIDQLGCLFGGH